MRLRVRCSRAPTQRKSCRSAPTTNCRRPGRTGRPSARLDESRRSARPKRGRTIVLVRLFLFVALTAIGVAVLLWLVKRDPRYLHFIALTLKFSVLMLLAILLWFAA